jgi:hypothetical protein
MILRWVAPSLLFLTSQWAQAYDVGTHRSMSATSAIHSALATDQSLLLSLGLDPRYFSDTRCRRWGSRFAQALSPRRVMLTETASSPGRTGESGACGRVPTLFK